MRLGLYGDKPRMTGYVTWVSIGFEHKYSSEIKSFVKAGKERTLNDKETNYW